MLGGGHSHVRGIWVCATLMTPLFRLLRCSRSRPSLLHLVSVLMPSVFRFFFFEKILAFLGSFLSDFGRISAPAPNTLILAKICSQGPSFLRKNPFGRPYFWKPMRHIPTKKKKKKKKERKEIECPLGCYATSSGSCIIISLNLKNMSLLI